MSRKKGLSVDEKRKRMLEFFYETEEVFQLKDIEKRCSKEKGITAQTIKDVLQSLVDDGMVDTDKVGTSNYFWAFPSKGVQARKRKISSLQEAQEEEKGKIAKFKESLIAARESREDHPDRVEILSELKTQQALKANYEKELAAFSHCDPEVIKAKEKRSLVAKEAANRWTDNIFAIESWCKRKFSMDVSAFKKQFGIPAELDYI